MKQTIITNTKTITKTTTATNRWHVNTEPCIDVKTYLRTDTRLKAGREYQGVLRRDETVDDLGYEEHLTFIETDLRQPQRRNPRVYSGEYITVTRRADGSLHVNFRDVRIDPSHAGIAAFATGVANELMWALEGLVEEA